MAQHAFQCKVRAKSMGLTYVWGSPDVKKPTLGQLFLVCRVDDLGESIQIKVKTSTSVADIDYGMLRATQSIVVPLADAVYVSAQPVANEGDSLLDCVLLI